MFENLHLEFTEFDIPVTNENYAHIMQNHYHKEKYLNPTESILSCDYCLDGSIYTLLPHPVSDYAREHLFYLKTFLLIYTKAQFFTRRQSEDSYMLLFTYDGKGILEYNGQKQRLAKGDGFIIDCRKPHYYKTEGPFWTHAVLHFGGSESETFYRLFQESQNCLFSQPTNGSFQNQFEELILVYERLSPYRELLVSSKLNALLTTLLTTSAFYEKTIQTIPENLNYLIKYIQNFYHQHLTLDFLAQFSGFSKPHLIRLFNKYLGCAPKEYITQLQLEHAKKLLETTTMPAAKIGAMVGIENSSYFGHLFKTRTGMSPGEFRTSKQRTFREENA